jgi:TPR repeat protein
MQFSKENIDLFQQNWELAHAQNSRNVDKAVEYADKALAFLNVEVAKESPEALYLKGNLYQYGVAEHLNTGIGQNMDIAKKFISEAAMHDFESAIIALDFINKETAPDYIDLKQGFENGDLDATYLFANSYFNDEWQLHDRFDMLMSNAESGHDPSMLATAENFRTGTGTELNEEYSQHWSKIAESSLSQNKVVVDFSDNPKP